MNTTELEKPPLARGLLWKLTFGFTFVALLVWFVAGTILNFAGFVAARSYIGDFWDIPEITKDAREISTWMTDEPVNKPAIKVLLKAYRNMVIIQRRYDVPFYTGMENYVGSVNELCRFVVVDANGRALVSTDDLESQPPMLGAKEQGLAEQVLDQGVAVAKFVDVDRIAKASIAIPILNGQDEIVGSLVILDTLPLDWQTALRKSVHDSFIEVQQGWILVILGLMFCFPIARHLTKRLNRIALATQTWSTGDFSSKTSDRSRDELGILSRRLDQMADDLRENFSLRQTITTAEERNRIARDLHDSVKQDVFALALQLRISQALVESKPDEAEKALGEAAKLVKQVQQELVSIIHELSPLNEQPKYFTTQIEKLVTGWSRQNSIPVEITTAPVPQLLPAVAQSLYRITQEALANITRHSAAKHVDVRIECEPGEKILITISDDGLGFDVQNVLKGFGLRNMQERAETMPSGRFSIDSEVGIGTRIKFGCSLAAEIGGQNE